MSHNDTALLSQNVMLFFRNKIKSSICKIRDPNLDAFFFFFLIIIVVRRVYVDFDVPVDSCTYVQPINDALYLVLAIFTRSQSLYFASSTNIVNARRITDYLICLFLYRSCSTYRNDLCLNYFEIN